MNKILFLISIAILCPSKLVFAATEKVEPLQIKCQITGQSCGGRDLQEPLECCSPATCINNVCSLPIKK